MKNEIYAMQINGATILVLTPVGGSKNILRFQVEKVGAQFAEKKIAVPGDIVFFVKLPMPREVKKSSSRSAARKSASRGATS